MIVTDRGHPAFVLLTNDAYRRLSGESGGSILDPLRQDAADFDFEPMGRPLLNPWSVG